MEWNIKQRKSRAKPVAVIREPAKKLEHWLFKMRFHGGLSEESLDSVEWEEGHSLLSGETGSILTAALTLFY